MHHSEKRFRVCVVTLCVAFLFGCKSTALGEKREDLPRTLHGARLRVLGTAQDGGFPHASCSCAQCDAARDGRVAPRFIASLALIDSDDRVFLIDATPDIREQLERLRDLKPPSGRVNRAPVDGIFLTHAHLGHYTGLGFLGFEAVHTQGLPLYVTERMGTYLSQNGPWSQLVEIGNVRLVTLTPGRPVEIEPDLSVTAIRVPHRDEFSDTVGFLVSGPHRTLFYVPDTDGWERWETPLSLFLDEHEVDIAIVDGTFFSIDELPGRDIASIGHPLIEDSIRTLQERVADGRLEVYFTHFNHSNPILGVDPGRRAQVEASGFAILEDGLELPL